MATGVTFTGGKELERNLLGLSQKMAKKIARAAVRKTAKPVYDAVRAGVPVDQGRLKRAVRLRVDTLKNNRSMMSAAIDLRFDRTYRPAKTDRARYSYQIGSNPKIYGRFVEFGTNDTRAQPFFRPAWDSLGGQAAIDRMGDHLWQGISAEIGKV